MTSQRLRISLCFACGSSISSPVRRGKPPIYCGDECRRAARASRRARQYERVCIRCGLFFSTTCRASVACTGCANAFSQIVRTANAIARLQRTCEQCGVSFIMRNASGKARRGEVREGRFCSRRCAMRWRNHRPQPGQGNLFFEATP